MTNPEQGCPHFDETSGHCGNPEAAGINAAIIEAFLDKNPFCLLANQPDDRPNCPGAQTPNPIKQLDLRPAQFIDPGTADKPPRIQITARVTQIFISELNLSPDQAESIQQNLIDLYQAWALQYPKSSKPARKIARQFYVTYGFYPQELRAAVQQATKKPTLGRLRSRLG